MPRPAFTPPLALAIALSLAVTALVFWCGGPAGLAYLALYLLALVPGLPIGWRLFGKAQPAGWVAGALIGYGLTALALWVPLRFGAPMTPAFVFAWLVVLLAAWATEGRSTTPEIPLPPFTRRDATAWLSVMLLVVVLLALPFGRLGEQDARGTRYYRAYFTADFVWHSALTQELARFEWPPRNPFFAHDPVHYYWTYFLVPAVASGPAEQPLVSVETALKINAIGTALLMFSMVFLATWAATARAGASATACVIALMAPSFEGLYKIVEYLRRGAPLAALRDQNIDAITAWDFHGLRIDGLVRSMWYTPQHSTSFALGLVALLVASRLTGAPRPRTVLTTGLALALSVIMNPLLGAAFCGIYGITVLYDVVTRRAPMSAIFRHALAVVPVLFALAWCLFNRMAEGAASHLTFGWQFDARNAPILTLFLSLGGLLIPAALGLLPWRRVEWRPVVPAIPGVLIGLCLLYFVSLSDRSWVGFRAGNILQVTLPLLAARGLAGLWDSGQRAVVGGVTAVILLAGCPTTIVDTYNAQDITNLHMGPGFPWTITLSPAQQAACAWIRRNTHTRAIVQTDPLARDRQNWSIIPTFAGRRMAMGQALPLLPEPQQEAGRPVAHAILTTLPLEKAHDEAHQLGIDYLWIDGDDIRAKVGANPRRFLERPDLFPLVFSQDDVYIYRVN